ncbi:MAG: tRNA (adenosine(37)-N6)-threonylcarbamoyltransferase complex dimerization subunit type 1 TsaB [Deltaproteobacteria bacterium]|nr:tRNA (adenosine(37)-N6)-threonylcarbamoyltransferase complex dimerization subunit type 1 TsaB [Deltaproteobacteria bacterium]
MLLAIDTSTCSASVALCEGERCHAEQWTEGGGGHGGALIPLIAGCCAMAGITAAALTGVAVAVGPGAFTGLRVGIATAQAVAMARRIPLVGVSSLAAMARHLVGGAPSRCATAMVAVPLVAVPLFDARRGEIYGAAYAVATGHELIPPTLATPDEFARQVTQLDGTVCCFGDGWVRYQPLIASVIGHRLVPPEPAMHRPSARFVAAIGAARLQAGDDDPVATVLPQYLRPSYAEKQREGA